MVRILEKIIEPNKVYEKQLFKIKLKIAEDKNIVNYTGDFHTNNVEGSLPRYIE